jgi:hypothetical protein
VLAISSAHSQTEEDDDMQKTAFQKMVEKALMLERNDELSIIPAKRSDGQTTLVVGLSTSTGFTPLAVLLAQVDINKLEPDFDKLDSLEQVLARARESISAKRPDEFTDLPEYDYMSLTAVSELGLG